MFDALKCFASAIIANGIQGAIGLLPGGQYLDYLVKVGGDAIKRYRELNSRKKLEDEMKELIVAKADVVLAAAKQAVEETAPQLPQREKELLLQFVTAIPEAARQSLKRPEDPSGKTVPAGFTLHDPRELAKLLPQSPPRFVPGDWVPGREGNWKLERRVGGGGFGEVWLARQQFNRKEKPRAVKFCTDPVSRQKLIEHEKHVILRVMEHVGEHDNIVPLLEFHLSGDTPWLMYEFVEGGTLAETISGWQQLRPDDRQTRALPVLQMIANAVGCGHAVSPAVVHRDLKPANVLMTGNFPRITDYGIGGIAVAFQVAEQKAGTFTTKMLRMPSMLSGSYSLMYSSPQQQNGSPPDPRDDVHALGVIAYQMLVGDLSAAPGTDVADDLGDLGTPVALIDLIKRSVSQKADRRPKDAREWESAISALIPGEVIAQPLQDVSKPIDALTTQAGTVKPLDHPKDESEAGPKFRVLREVVEAITKNGISKLAGMVPDAPFETTIATGARFKPNDPLPGLAGWYLVELLGVGGFGEVWLACHRSMSSLRGAVKFWHGQRANELRHESDLIDRVMSAGRHKNIVPLMNVSLEGELPWLMYEYVPGGDLTELIRSWQKLDAEKRVRQTVLALRQISTAVAHFHRLTPAIVHRDLKPANILLDRTNNQLRITDFGIGAVAAKAALSEELRTGTSPAGQLSTAMRGSHTPLYASPQQREGQAPDARDDVHALGVIGYQLIAGHLNQGAGPDFADDLREHGASEALIALLGRCVAARPDRRPKDAAELAEALALLGTGTTTNDHIPPPGSHSNSAQPEPSGEVQPAEPGESESEEDEFWFVNVGESQWEDDEGNTVFDRNWDDCRKYGFLSAGGGPQYSNAVKRLYPGAKVFAYMKGLGYVGYGVVTKAAVMARNFIPQGSTTPLLKLPLGSNRLCERANDEDLTEWVVAVRWLKTFDREEAKTFSGAFANQNVVCRFREPKTLRYLKRKFNVSE